MPDTLAPLSVLIVSQSERGADVIKDSLESSLCLPAAVASDTATAAHLLYERSFALVIVNPPFADGDGRTLACAAVRSGASALLLVRGEDYDRIYAEVSGDGVLTLPKPLQRATLVQTLRMINTTRVRLAALTAENRRLSDKLEEVKLVDRAKWALIRYLKMDEAQAHRFIEKQAMDMRLSRREVAEGILKTYE